MLWEKLILLVLIAVMHTVKTQRKIKGGIIVDQDKRYMVYLVKAPGSPREYDTWLCGGAIVSIYFIVTSAACVEDVQNMYAIAGYKKFVPSHLLDSDQCTQVVKKRVIFTCVPRGYDFDYAKVDKWSYIDIAAVKVESAFDFNSKMWNVLCSYQPVAIPINYDVKHQEPGLDSIVLGWGHLDRWRKPEDPNDYNQQDLRFAATLIHDKNECKKFFAEYRAMAYVIDKYMICTLEAGNIDAKGNLMLKNRPVADGCTHNEERLRKGDIVCEEDETILIDTRKTFSNILARQQNMTRRQGFCQNDHGGPLVTWVGTHEVLIGVASVFRVTQDSLCTGPYLYTSTQCNGAFLDCVINSDDTTRRREICDRDPSERGFDTIETHVSWVNLPNLDGSAEKEKEKMTPTPQVHIDDNKWDTQKDDLT